MDTRTCSKCGETKPTSDFYLDKGQPRRNCKDCHKAAVAERRSRPDWVKPTITEADREKNRERERQRRAREGAEINAKRRAQRAANPERHRAQQKAWRDANLERAREAQRRSYAKNRERIRAKMNAKYAADPEGTREASRRWRRENPEKVRAANRNYYAANPELYEIHRRKREARKAGVEYQPYTRREIYDRDGGTCWECGKDLPFAANGFQLDHIVPISLGGPDIPANLQLMCAKCNRAKWANLDGQIHLPV